MKGHGATKIAWLALALGWACEARHPPPAPNRPDGPRSPAPEARAGQVWGDARKKALLVGIGAYPRDLDAKRVGWPFLRGPPNDVEALSDRLQRLGFEVRTLVDEEATFRAIEQAFDETLAGLGRLDVGVFFFAGHGHTVSDEDGDELDDEDEALVPYDFAADGGTYILDDRIHGWIDRVKSGHLLVLLDSCHSGTATRDDGPIRGPRVKSGGPPRRRAREDGVLLDLIKPKGHGPERSVVVLTAADAGQRAVERPSATGEPRGAFTDALVELMDSGLPATYTELRDRIHARLAAKSLTQIPVLEPPGDSWESENCVLRPFSGCLDGAEPPEPEGWPLWACCPEGRQSETCERPDLRQLCQPGHTSIGFGMASGISAGIFLEVFEPGGTWAREIRVSSADAGCACLEGIIDLTKTRARRPARIPSAPKLVSGPEELFVRGTSGRGWLRSRTATAADWLLRRTQEGVMLMVASHMPPVRLLGPVPEKAWGPMRLDRFVVAERVLGVEGTQPWLRLGVAPEGLYGRLCEGVVRVGRQRSFRLALQVDALVPVRVVVLEVDDDDIIRTIPATHSPLYLKNRERVAIGRFELGSRRTRLRAIALRASDGPLDLRPLLSRPRRNRAARDASPLVDLLDPAPHRTGVVRNSEPRWATATLVLEPETGEACPNLTQ